MEKIKKTLKKQQSLKNFGNWNLKQNLNIHRKRANTEWGIPLDSLNDSQPIYESIDELEEKQQSDSFVEHKCRAVRIYQPVSNDIHNFSLLKHNWADHPFLEIHLTSKETAKEICEAITAKSTSKETLFLLIVTEKGFHRLADEEKPYDHFKKWVLSGKYKENKFLLRRNTEFLRFYLSSDLKTYWTLKVYEETTAKKICDTVSERLGLSTGCFTLYLGNEILHSNEKILQLYHANHQIKFLLKQSSTKEVASAISLGRKATDDLSASIPLAPTPSLKQGFKYYVRAVRTYSSQNVKNDKGETDVSFKEGDIMGVVEERDSEWLLVGLKDSLGLVKSSFVVKTFILPAENPQESDEDSDGADYLFSNAQKVKIDPNWQIVFTDLKLKKLIGGGNYGQVISGLYKGEKVAIKKMLYVPGADTEKYWQREIDLLQTLHHPNLVKFIGCCQTDDALYLVTELVARGDLKRLLHDEAISLSWTIRLKMAMDIVSALLYFLSENFIHRDIKSDNMLITSDFTIKLCDFGLARQVRNNMTVCGTQNYMAPEIYLGENYDSKVDVFSFGVVLVEMITRKDLPERTAKNFFAFPIEKFKENIPFDCPSELIDLTLACLKRKPTERIDAKALYQRLQTITIDSAAL